MKTNEKVLLELKKLGLMPEVHEDNIFFKYQMLSYLYLNDAEDEDYYAMYLPYRYSTLWVINWKICLWAITKLPN